MEALSLFDAASASPDTQPSPSSSPEPRALPPRPLQPAARRPTLLAVDGNSLAHRAFHAYGTAGLASGGAADRGALYGFLALFAAVCDRTSPDAVVVGFDCRESSERRARFPAYKANRPDKDPALYALLDLAAAALADLGVTVVVPPGWEADDVVGSAARAGGASRWQTVVATSDRDAFALVDQTTTVLRLRSGMDNAEVIDPAWIRRRLRIQPGQYTEFAALRGDPSDNLQGISGIGPARAAALLALYPTVAEAVADPMGCRSVLGPDIGQALVDDLASDGSVFRRNVELMTVRRDLDIDVEGCRRVLAPQHVEQTCVEWGLPTLAGRLAVAVGARPERPEPPALAPPG